MNKMKLTALLLAAAMGCGIFTACGDKKEKGGDSSSSSSVADESSAETATYDAEGYKDIIMENIEKADNSDEPFKFGALSDVVTPPEDDDEADLGQYRQSESGVKYYFSETDYPADLMQTLEQYFTSFAEADYTAYSRCIYPEYRDKMDEFLKNDYEYDLKESFALQCTNLANTMNGKYSVTRLKMEVPAQYDESKDNLEAYFERFSEILGEDYYEKLVKDVDKVYDGEFYVMAKDRLGNESLLISAFEIVFVEKDGRYYVFG